MPHEVRISGELKMAALVLMGHHGTLLKSCMPLRMWYADTLGLTHKVCNMFRESCVCGINLLHITVGQFLSMVQKLTMRWFLNVWMACLAAFTLWLCGLTNCILISLSSR